MHRLNPGCWIWSPCRDPLCLPPQHPGIHPSGELVPQEEEEEEEEEEEAGENLVVCCYTLGIPVSFHHSGCYSFWGPLKCKYSLQGSDDLTAQAVDAHWSTSIHSGIPGSSGSSGRNPSQQMTLSAADGELPQNFHHDLCWEGHGTESHNQCVCGQGSVCWPGSPYLYYGVRRNMVVGVEVVEEVAVEDTLEVITEDVYTDDLLDPDLLQDPHLYPT